MYPKDREITDVMQQVRLSLYEMYLWGAKWISVECDQPYGENM